VPELPDLTVYRDHLDRRTVGDTLITLRTHSPFVLRSVAPAPDDLAGRRVLGWSRLAKQLVLVLDASYYVVFHLMIAGRLQWQAAASLRPPRTTLATLSFSRGALVFTEAGTKKRASLRIVHGADALSALDPGGVDIECAGAEEFARRVQSSSHTLKRLLTDQRIIAGIGNAYSDEILHAARMSPFKRGQSLTDDECRRLHAACRSTLDHWTHRLRERAGDAFPKRVTAFHPDMAVHGRYRQPCPVCGSPVQRIVHADNESNYCARCQTGGKVLADRALSRLLKDDWPRRVEDLE
jgi:formamidopyrimidine-DNA glycosylase